MYCYEVVLCVVYYTTFKNAAICLSDFLFNFDMYFGFRHVVYAPSIHNSYHGVGFSGFLDAVCDAKVSGDFEVVKQQLSVITFHLLSAAKMLESP